MRVLHLPINAGANPWYLSRGERELGISSDVLVKESNWLRYPADINLALDRYPRICKPLVMAQSFLKYRSLYDIFHFNMGSSFLHFPGSHVFHWDLPYFPKGAKKYATYQGCDIRQKMPTMARRTIASCHETQCYGGRCNSGRLDELRRRSLKRMAPYVNHIWAVNPDLLWFLPPEKSSFLPYAVGVEEYVKSPLKEEFAGPVRILHAPTDRGAKGSTYILKGLQSLQQKYPEDVEILLVENMPHKEALEKYRQADIVVDQILLGWYGALAVEAMALGKAVISRIEPADLHFIPELMQKDLSEALCSAGPSDFLEKLEEMIQNRRVITDYGKAGREYALKWHHPRRVATIVKEQYERDGAVM